MSSAESVASVVLAAAAVVLIVWIARRFFSADARYERRRRRSNFRVTSTAKRPMVKLSVRTKKRRRK